MIKPLVSRHKADCIAGGFFFLILAVIAYLGSWWPGIMIPIGIGLIIRQVLLGKYYDAFISLIVFGGIFATIQFDLSWLPVLFVVAGIYILYRAFFDEPEDEVEEEEEVQKELEEKEEQDTHL